MFSGRGKIIGVVGGIRFSASYLMFCMLGQQYFSSCRQDAAAYINLRRSPLFANCFTMPPAVSTAPYCQELTHHKQARQSKILACGNAQTGTEPQAGKTEQNIGLRQCRNRNRNSYAVTGSGVSSYRDSQVCINLCKSSTLTKSQLSES